jgi:hypothetical protein
MIGITTWIKTDVLRGTRFRRPSTRRGGNALAGVSLGRQVDRLFKHWCETGKIGTGRPAATSRLRHVIAAMAAAKLRPVAANKFVTLNGIRTHLDGVAVDRAGRTVVVELKSTQSTSAQHSVAYRSPCANRPATRFGANTEELHHQLQTAFGVAAHGSAAYGIIVVACSNKAMLYTVLPKAFPARVFRIAAGAPTPSPPGTPWPAAAVAGVVGRAAIRSSCGRYATVTATGGAAVALKAPPGRASASEVAAAVSLLSTRPRPRHLVYPEGGRWRRRCVP